MEMFQILLFHIQADYPGGNKCYVIVARDQGKKLSPAKEDSGHTVRLLGGFNEQFGDLADEMAIAIVRFSAQQIGSVQHFASFLKTSGADCSGLKVEPEMTGYGGISV